MKLVRPLTLCALVLLAPTRIVSGADAYGRDINSPSANDPSTASQPQEREMTDEEIAQEKKQQEKAAADREWMARGVDEYRSRNSTQSTQSSLYERLSTNKELAKLAGIALPEASAGDDAKPFRTGVTTPGRSTVSLRTDPSEKKTSMPPAFGTFKPLIQPMGFIDKALPPFVQPPPIKTSSPEADADLLDSPGMTAAAKNPILDRGYPDLKFDLSTLDPLPDSKTSSAFSKGQLPISSNADRLRMQPMAPTATAKAQPTNTSINPEKVELPPDLEPAKPIPFSPIRPPIADTHDILFR